MEGYVSELWDFTRISVTQNNLQVLKEVWDQWDDETRQLFYCNYGDLHYLLDVKVDKHLFRALAQYWNLAYNCFTFGVDVFALSIYKLVIFPKVLGQIDEAVSDLFDRLDKKVRLLEIWVAIGYAHLLVLRQYRSRQFIPATQGLTQCEFAYKGDSYKKKVCEISNAWNQTHRMKRFAINPMVTPECDWW
ncbi:hypothetical protein Goari_027504 [Gossypium aridum]|uniref:DUF7745 domain-containing protein n=1 Tax=Gossypium aridum TaxID=34290 RepID=A0A7J8YU21_GOSAI|nr:hypothetical protein [Gossypium aridum]